MMPLMGERGERGLCGRGVLGHCWSTEAKMNVRIYFGTLGFIGS